MTVIHVLHDVFMGYQQAGLSEILKDRTGREGLKKGELAVFLNKKWTACKVMAPGNILLYLREPAGGYITLEDIRRLPTVFGGKLLTFGGNTEQRLMRAFENQFGKRAKRIKAVS